MAFSRESVFLEASVGNFDVQEVKLEPPLDSSEFHGQAVGRVLNDVHLEEAGHQAGELWMVPVGFLWEVSSLQ